MNNKLDCSPAVITRGKVFQPTQRLRFIERLTPIDEHTVITVRVLQQMWADLYSPETDWRDVPLEEETQ